MTEQIPRVMVANALKNGFTDDSTKISKAATAAATSLITLFVRETIMRAHQKRLEVGDGEIMLEVEDLEAVMGAMLSDFL